jgi:DNA polymerase IIIc chi subunit
MEDILKSYKERLIKISGRNRSLCCKKLPKKHGFDLQKINEIKDEELKKWLINRYEKKFNIIDDPYKLSTSDLRKIKDELETKEKLEIQNLKEKYLDKLECEELKIKIDEINQKYRKELQDEEEKLKKQLDNILVHIHSLKSLSKEITALKKETGRDELYIGYPFVEGKFKDNSFVRAPLFLFPVSININGSTVSLLNNVDSPILLNKVFILAHSKFNETKAIDMEVKCESLNEDFIQDTLKELKKNDIHITYQNNEIEKFREYTEKNIPDYSIGTLFIKNYTVLGQFPISNSIYTDYKCLEGKDKGQLLKDLLHTKNNASIGDYEIKEEHGKLSFSEKDLYFVSNLDYSQEKAVKKASESKNLVIYGPPGTGKSQTIVNIIADALAKNKRVLMVSQKKAALDVIYNRLGSLNSKAIIVHDANKDKKAFYEKIKNTLEDVKVNDMNLENNISLKAEIIDEHIQMLEFLAKVLNEKRDYGISLQEMYAISSDIASKEDYRYEDFLKFRRKNSFKSYKYQQLNEVVNNLDGAKLSAFISRNL